MILNEIYRYWMVLRARIYFYREGYRNGGLPCWHCCFTPDELDGKFYPVWLTCTNPEFGGAADDGCNWGNI